MNGKRMRNITSVSSNGDRQPGAGSVRTRRKARQGIRHPQLFYDFAMSLLILRGEVKRKDGILELVSESEEVRAPKRQSVCSSAKRAQGITRP